MPTREDFAAQLRRSIDIVQAERGADVIFDRSPLDLVGYLGSIDRDNWEAGLGAAMARRDLIVLVTIESPDRIAVDAHEDRRLRRRVDEAISTLGRRARRACAQHVHVNIALGHAQLTEQYV